MKKAVGQARKLYKEQLDQYENQKDNNHKCLITEYISEVYPTLKHILYNGILDNHNSCSDTKRSVQYFFKILM